MKERLRILGRRFLSVGSRRRLVRYTRWPPIGLVRFGQFRRLSPISNQWGSERGQPIDRYYIEKFLSAWSGDIRGHVLEIDNDSYTQQFGGDRVTKSSVLHVAERKPGVTIIGDLTNPDSLPLEAFDCVILTQTLQFIYDVPAAINTIYRILRPGGVVLATVPGISQISRYDMDRWGHFWCFTTLSLQKLFEAEFPVASIQISAQGNVLAAISLLEGLASGDLRKKELNHTDPDYQVIITVRAQKPVEKA
jgi:SAM-dependent methyltransferase